ncbi:MAG: aminotransferase class I/II-fold pyridoxal phosphate-dependent enzyme [Chthoniobacterales bacterium]|nr:aminotransferase class I/II-fold pyridoxal phosphate-dependent enzyme [Chthoniobacterales bacterium]
MNTNNLSRRRFAQLLGAGAAAALTRPSLTLAREAPKGEAVSRLVRLSSNENPYGPSAKALKAVTDAFDLACRYPDDNADVLIDALARHNRVEANQILLGAGSGEILKICATAFTGPSTDGRAGTAVVADPTFEPIANIARERGAELVKVPLTSNYAHDLEKMLDALKGGLVYICNPNNPTASITPKAQLGEFIMKAPQDTMVLVDEAYHHYVESADYESVIPLIADHPNLLVARTFSKIYGMAGLRCGYCIGQADVIARLRPLQLNDGVNITALVAATTSLADAEQVANGKRMNKQARGFTVSELERMGYQSIPSEANFIMFDLKQPVVPFIEEMKQRDVHVGRLFPTLPNHMRVTIGKKREMERFVSAFREVAQA